MPRFFPPYRIQGFTGDRPSGPSTSASIYLSTDPLRLLEWTNITHLHQLPPQQCPVDYYCLLDSKSQIVATHRLRPEPL